MATKARKDTTLADLMAAAALGTIDPTTVVLTAEQAAKAAKAAAKAAADDRPAAPAPAPLAAPSLSATEHECGIAGCRHGTAHPAVSQPDRQVKLQCPVCGAVARMTAGAIRKAGGTPTCADGGAFAEAARRTYTRRAA